MKLIEYIRNLFFNICGLIKIASKSKTIFWTDLVGNISHSSIDSHTKLYKNHSLSHVTVGKGSYIGYNALVSNTTIGKFCSIGPNLCSGWGMHPIHGISTSPAFFSTKKQAGFTFSEVDKYDERKQITIGNDVFIGWNVTILDGVTIGDGAVIGAGAVVSKDIPPYAVAVGCPIQILKYRFSKKIIESLIESKWWDQEDSVLKEVEKNFFDVEKFLELIKGDKTI
jgi:acetyltransferase-like isoleucine patch superfamily enzyme